MSRRQVLAASLLLPLASAKAAGAAALPTRGKRALVVYFSRTGNTRVIARQIGRALGAAMFEIQPARPYPDDYQETVEQARRERDDGIRPALQAGVPDIEHYDTIYLGFPIWGETAPPVIRSFLAGHDLTGKTLVPFITHGGFGPGNSLSVLAAHAPKARIVDTGFVMQDTQEKQTLQRVTDWLGKVRAD
jgi:flavodoxin